MKQSKRLPAALLALVLLFGLSACARREKPAAPVEPARRATAILSQPYAKPGAVGTDLFLSVEAEGEDLCYQWQYRSSAEGEWHDCGKEGCDTPNYTVRLKEHHEGYQFRCRVSGADGELCSEPVTLELIERPYVSVQPESLSAAAGDKVSFTVLAGGGGLKYQWYFRKSVKGSWIPCSGEGCHTERYSVAVKNYHDGYQYRCEVSNGLGKACTQVVTLTIDS
ncbi:MAG: fibronectin type III domain-containing protein [Oscillospiraceae bacterium]|nr:fibronectin type III domain-containing protein [Oscillospiraceae bacterium]